MSGMLLRDWRAFRKNTLRGFATIELPSGLVIHDVAVHAKGDSSWASMPSVPQMQGTTQRVVDGKGQWKRILEWKSKELSEGFSAKLVSLVRGQNPNALE